MTLARTALRLCAVACLEGIDGARPTIAEGRVYDSRMSDFGPEPFGEDARPTMILLTDDDDGEALSDQNGGPPFRRMMGLVIEMGMTLAIKDEAGYSVGYPDTDSRLEASLDLLEFQVMRRLAYDHDPLPTLFRKLVRIRKSDCHRQVTDEAGLKLAARVLTLTCDVGDDRIAAYNTASTTPAIPTGFDILPEPLRSVAKGLPAGSPGLEVCISIAAALSPLTVPPLRGFDMVVTNENDAPEIEAPTDLPQDTPA